MNQPPVTTPDVTLDLASQLASNEERPLEERAAGFVHLHDRLRDHLEGGDVPRSAAPGTARS